jgi:hypothetical protein
VTILAFVRSLEVFEVELLLGRPAGISVYSTRIHDLIRDQPLLAPTAVTVGLLAFLSAIRDISTTVLLYSAQSRPLSILMMEYGFAGQMERSAAIGVLVTLFVLGVTLAARVLGLRLAGGRA